MTGEQSRSGAGGGNAGPESPGPERGPGGRANQGFTYRERLGARARGATALAYLTAHYRHSTEAAWRERIEAGRVLLEGVPLAPDSPLTPGAVLEWRRPPWEEPEPPGDVAVLREDSHLLAVDKPAGLPTLPGAGYLDYTLLAVVRRRFPEAAPLHRLGRWTSGIVLFARTGAARTALSAYFRNRDVVKVYRALASGRPDRERWAVDTPIGPVPHRLLGTVHGASSTGRASHSEVAVVERRADAFLADVVIRTGRPHQIRIHLAACGHPLAGDPLYPPGGVPDPGTQAVPGDPGYRLHAMRLGIRHPATGELLDFASPCPPDLVSLRQE